MDLRSLAWRRFATYGTPQSHHAKVEEISRAGPFHDFERSCRFRKNRRKSKSGRRGVHEESGTDSQDRCERSSPPTREDIFGYQGHICPGRDRQNRRNSCKYQIPPIHRAPQAKSFSTSSWILPFVLRSWPE